ncbi:hypothetical protein ID0469_03120 [Helicobacter pylori]
MSLKGFSLKSLFKDKRSNKGRIKTRKTNKQLKGLPGKPIIIL